MATNSHTQHIDQTQQTPGSEVTASFARRFRPDCRTAADVRAQAAHVQAFRAKVWPQQRPSVPQRPAPKAPAPPVLAEQAPAATGRISVRRVLEVTADHFGAAVADLLSGCRKQPLCRHRQIAMYVAHRTTGRSLPFIGRHMGDRDHTTILHGVRAVKALIDAGDGDTISAVNQIVEKLTGGANE